MPGAPADVALTAAAPMVVVVVVRQMVVAVASNWEAGVEMDGVETAAAPLHKVAVALVHKVEAAASNSRRAAVSSPRFFPVIPASRRRARRA